jgi:hypothetical protein
VTSQENRGYNLHIEAAWEHSLPNLDPRRGEITIDWAVRSLVDGLLAGVIKPNGNGVFSWVREDAEAYALGSTLSAMLYSVGQLHRADHLRKRFQQITSDTLSSMAPDERKRRAQQLSAWLDRRIEDSQLRKLDARESTEDLVDEPVSRVLLKLMTERASDGVAQAGGGSSGFPTF